LSPRILPTDSGFSPSESESNSIDWLPQLQK